MRVIKGENQYAIVVSKDELRYLTACVGASRCPEIYLETPRVLVYQNHSAVDYP